MPNNTQFVSAAAFCFMTTVAAAGEVDVEAVSFKQATDGSYRFDVTLRHADAGWDHMQTDGKYWHPMVTSLQPEHSIIPMLTSSLLPAACRA